MGNWKELTFEEVIFEDEIEEIRSLIFGESWEDGNNGYWNPPYRPRGFILDHPDVKEIDKTFESGGEDEYLYMKYVFEYKGKFYSIIKNEDSGGNSGWETDALKQVFPKEITKTIYQ